MYTDTDAHNFQFRSNWLVDSTTGSYHAAVKSPTGIAADPALTAHGIGQAKQLAAHLVTLDPPIGRVYSSPYYRCLQTVEPFVRLATTSAAVRDPLLVRCETGIAEWYGTAPFEHPTPAPLETLGSLFPGLLDPSYQPALVPRRRGESIDQLHARAARAVRAIIEQCDRDGVRAVLLCSHAATLIALGRVLTGSMPDHVGEGDFNAFTCGLSVFRRRHDVAATANADGQNGQDGLRPRGGWDCVLNSDCSFLVGGEERGW